MPYENNTRAALASRSQTRRDNYQTDQEAALEQQYQGAPGFVGALNGLRSQMVEQNAVNVGNPWDAWMESVSEAQEDAASHGKSFRLMAGPSPTGSNQLTGFSAQTPNRLPSTATTPGEGNWQSLESPWRSLEGASPSLTALKKAGR